MRDDERQVATTAAEVRALLSDLFQVRLEPSDDGQPLNDIPDVDYDSATVLECVALVEERFGVSIDVVDDDLRHTFRSVGSIAKLVARKLSDQAVMMRDARSTKHVGAE